MARGRMLNQTIAADPEFNQMSIEAQFLYMRTVPHLDRDGLILGHPFVLWGRVAPLTGPDFMQKTPGLIEEWMDAGLVIQYESKLGEVLFFKGFAKNQAGMRYDREAESPFPPPPGYQRGKRGIEPIAKGDEKKSFNEADAGSDEPPKDAPDDESIPDGNEGSQHPGDIRQDSGRDPAAVPPEVEHKHQQEREDPRESVQGEGKKSLSQASPSDGYFGIHDPRSTWDSWREVKLRDYPGIKADLLTALTNELKKIRGYSALVNNPGKDELEIEFRDEAYDCWKMGCADEDTMAEMHEKWLRHARKMKYQRTKPWKGQFYKFVCEVASGGHSGGDEYRISESQGQPLELAAAPSPWDA